MNVPPPVLTETLAVMRDRASTPEEHDLLAAIEHTDETHQGANADAPGPCLACDQPWPCPQWVEAEYLAVVWLGRSSRDAIDRARQHLDAFRRAA